MRAINELLTASRETAADLALLARLLDRLAGEQTFDGWVTKQASTQRRAARWCRQRSDRLRATSEAASVALQR